MFHLSSHCITTAINLVRKLSGRGIGPTTAAKKIKNLSNKLNKEQILNISPKLTRENRINKKLDKIIKQTDNRVINQVISKQKFDKIALNGSFKEVFLIDPNFTTIDG